MISLPSVSVRVAIKSVLVGMLAGAAICGSVWWLSARREPPNSQPAATSTPRASSISPGASNTHVEEATRRAGPESIGSDVADRGQPGIAETSKIPTSKNTTRNHPTSEESPADSATESETVVEISDIATARRRKETKDLAWSYNTEQALRQFFAAHELSANFDFTLVDCRTTFCEIEAVASDADAWPTWMQIEQDATKQPWSEFGPHGSSHGMRNGRSVFVMTLFRLDPARPGSTAPPQ